MKNYFCLLFGTIIILSNQTFAAQSQTPKKTSPALTKPQPMPISSKPMNSTPIAPGLSFGFDLNTRYTIQAEKQADGTRNEYLTYEFIPAFKTQDFRIRSISDFYYFVKDQSTNEWDNTSFEATLNTPWNLGAYFDLKPDLILALPIFRRTTDFNNYLGGRLTLILNSKNIGAPSLLFKYGVQFGKLSFKNEKTGADYNIDTRLRQRVHLGYQFTDAISALIYFHYDSNFLLDNSVRNAFYHETAISYAFIPDHVTLDLGVANGGGVFAGENQEIDNLKFYNEKSSEAFIQLNLGI